jgi:anaerobic magnesium-protoporphyrin IX monomethyl ester cyclase
LNIILIDANSSWLADKSRLKDLEQIIPPIGLMSIATCLKNRFKDRVNLKVVNMVADCPDQDSLLRILKNFKPDLAGIRGMDIYKNNFHNIAATIKRFRQQVTVIGGGPYVTMDIKSAARDKNVDYFVIGEGEITVSEIIKKMLGKRDVSDTRGIAYWRNADFVTAPPQPFIADLDRLPCPDYNLISVDKYSKFISYGYNRRRQAVILSSRGCTYRCIYCHNIFGKKFRMRSAQNIFLEIQALYEKFGIRDFYFVDDNFNLDYQRAMQMFDRIIKSKLKINIYFSNGIRGDIVDRPFIDKMVEAGVIWADFSIETASPRLQKYIRKFVNLEKMADNLHYACDKNIMVNCCVMVGFPTETQEEANSTIDFLKQFKKIVIPMFFSVKYYPQTEIHGLALMHGIKAGDIENAYAQTYHSVKHAQTPLIPEKAFRDIYFKFLNEVFLDKQRLLNAIEIQKRFLSTREILDVYSIFFRKRVKDLKKDVLYYAK